MSDKVKGFTIVYPIGKGIYINLTNRCSCACTFCLRNNAPGIFGSQPLWLEREPTVNEVCAQLATYDEADYAEVVFCGYGEPTMRLDELMAVADFVKRNKPGLNTRLNTNGLANLVHKIDVPPLLKGRIDTVSISLNTPDAEEYERVCRPQFGIKSWQAMIDFARECVMYVPDVVMTVVDEPVTSKAKQEECRKIAESLGARLRVRPYESK